MYAASEWMMTFHIQPVSTDRLFSSQLCAAIFLLPHLPMGKNLKFVPMLHPWDLYQRGLLVQNPATRLNLLGHWESSLLITRVLERKYSSQQARGLGRFDPKSWMRFDQVNMSNFGCIGV